MAVRGRQNVSPPMTTEDSVSFLRFEIPGPLYIAFTFSHVFGNLQFIVLVDTLISVWQICSECNRTSTSESNKAATIQLGQ